MEPSIQYAKTSDGVSIAFWTLGEGNPFVHMPSAPFIPALRLWHTPRGRRWCELLAEKRKLVRYDYRGFGHSDRDVADFSIEARVTDLDAVIERVAPERVALFGYFWSGPVAIAYAAHRPERVSHLVLWCTSPRGGDLFESDAQHQALSELAEKDWTWFTESFAHRALGWSAGDEARQFAGYLRETATPAAVRSAWNACFDVDVSDLVPQVRAPTLVIQRRGLDAPGMNVAHGIAAHIPDARLAVVEGELVIPYADDMEDVLRTIDDFLGEGPPPVEVDLEEPVDTALTSRETEVLTLVASGWGNKEIAQKLSLSIHTVQRHVANIYNKIGARGRADATAYAIKRRLL